MTAVEAIDLSISEDRSVWIEPSTIDEYEAILTDLLTESDGETDSTEITGDDGVTYLDIWSEDGWRVKVVYPSSAD